VSDSVPIPARISKLAAQLRGMGFDVQIANHEWGEAPRLHCGDVVILLRHLPTRAVINGRRYHDLIDLAMGIGFHSASGLPLSTSKTTLETLCRDEPSS
jgi:hypothetical protein